MSYLFNGMFFNFYLVKHSKFIIYPLSNFTKLFFNNPRSSIIPLSAPDPRFKNHTHVIYAAFNCILCFPNIYFDSFSGALLYDNFFVRNILNV